MDALPQNSSTCGHVRPMTPIRPIASERLEAGAIAMAPVPRHLLESMEALHAEYWSVRAECLKLNASNELSPLWEKKVEILLQTLGHLNEIRAAAMKLDRELQRSNSQYKCFAGYWQKADTTRPAIGSAPSRPRVRSEKHALCDRQSSQRPQVVPWSIHLN
jgi:hypothetical protein